VAAVATVRVCSAAAASNPCVSDANNNVDVQGEPSSVLEVYLFRHCFFSTGFNSLSIGLETRGGGNEDPAASGGRPANNTNASSLLSSTLVQAERAWNESSLLNAGRCVTAASCYNHTFRVPVDAAAANSSEYRETLPLSVTLDGVNYAHQKRDSAGGRVRPGAPDGGDAPIVSSSTRLGRCTDAACANASARSGEVPGPGGSCR
jgi:hypothetical protein